MAPAPVAPVPEIVTNSPGLKSEVPNRSSVPPEATVVPLFVAPRAEAFTVRSVPALIVTGPVKSLALVMVSVPVPDLVKDVGPLILPLPPRL